MSKNPFDDDEPGDYGASNNSGNDFRNNSLFSNDSLMPGGRYGVQSQIMDSKARIQASQQRALRSIANSEQIGGDTAVELVEQREKLTSAEQKLYEVENLQEESQRHINSLSSVFGGLKNFFRRKQQPAVPPPVRNTSNLPRTSVPSVASDSQLTHNQSNPHSRQANQASTPQSEFDENLTQMSAGMSRLKSLALDLNTEIHEQNDQLDRMGNRIEGVSSTMNRQNRQMNKLLGVHSK